VGSNDTFTSPANSTDYRVGDVFVFEWGSIVVLSVTRKPNIGRPGRSWWVVARCYCGRVFETRGPSLRGGYTRSCGCLAFEQRSKNGKRNAAKQAIKARIAKGKDPSIPLTTENDRRHTECEPTKKWVMSVRDGFRCRHCNEIGGRLQVHHVFPIKTHPELFNNPRFMITLCEDFHKEIAHPNGNFHAVDAKVQLQLLDILATLYEDIDASLVG